MFSLPFVPPRLPKGPQCSPRAHEFDFRFPFSLLVGYRPGSPGNAAVRFPHVLSLGVPEGSRGAREGKCFMARCNAKLRMLIGDGCPRRSNPHRAVEWRVQPTYVDMYVYESMYVIMSVLARMSQRAFVHSFKCVVVH